MLIHPVVCGFGYAFLIENPHGLFLIDCGSPGHQNQVLAKMDALQRHDLKLIWITHAHYDHYGSAAALREITGAPIGVHPNDAEDMVSAASLLGTTRSYGFLYPPMQSILSYIDPLPVTSPDFTLEDGDTLERFGLQATVLHTPGHTPGHTCMILDDGTAFVGDLIGRTFLQGKQRLLAVDWSQIPDSVQRLKSQQPERVFSGHSKRPLSRETIQRIKI
jgi:hydroxyacylglutathione hydrolase